MSSVMSRYRSHLAELLVAVERCVYFLNGSCAKLSWPLSGDELTGRNKEVDLFMALSAVNERFAKLQDTLGAAMRHAALLAGEPSDTFLLVLSHFEKVGVLSSVADWKGMTKGIAQSLLTVLTAKFGELPDTLKERRTLGRYFPVLIPMRR